MTVGAWLAECDRIQASFRGMGLDPEDARIHVIIVRKSDAKSDRVRVAPGLMGRHVYSERESDGRVRIMVDVYARDMRRFLATHDPGAGE